MNNLQKIEELLSDKLLDFLLDSEVTLLCRWKFNETLTASQVAKIEHMYNTCKRASELKATEANLPEETVAEALLGDDVEKEVIKMTKADYKKEQQREDLEEVLTYLSAIVEYGSVNVSDAAYDIIDSLSHLSNSDFLVLALDFVNNCEEFEDICQ